MIIDLDPSTSFASYVAAPATTAKNGQWTHARLSFLNPRRAEHEAQFEREHGSLWTPGLHDHLSLPLTRFHE